MMSGHIQNVQRCTFVKFVNGLDQVEKTYFLQCTLSIYIWGQCDFLKKSILLFSKETHYTMII